MKTYTTKPCNIVAVQWTGKNIDEIIQFAQNDACFDYSQEEPVLTISTLEGDMKASINDYIIKGLKGEFYPCKPDVFEKKYEEFEPTLSMGTLYEVNKEASALEPPMKRAELREALSEVNKYIQNTKNTYYMLLNKETSDYTIFKIDNPNKNFGAELKDVLRERGSIISIDPTDDGIAYEIWVRIEQEDFIFYLFPYDAAIVEI